VNKLYNGKVTLDIISEIDFAGMKANEIKKHIRLVCNKIIKSQFAKFDINEVELCVAIVDDETIKQLNKDFRKKNKPTNVLSFPNDDVNLQQISDEKLSKAHWMLGDVIISHETITKEAGNQQKNVIDHLTHMLVHGILHLIGYDHENDQDAKKMESLEESILSGFSIASPYIK
jgi:probable rRNA maturation factor